MARRTFVRRLASAGGAAIVTPSLAGLAACGDVAGPDDSGETDGTTWPPDNPMTEPYGELVILS